jgi:hypothetical protein
MYRFSTIPETMERWNKEGGPMPPDLAASIVSAVYKNHRGEYDMRRFIPISIGLIQLDVHGPKPKMCCVAWCLDRNAVRHFAMENFVGSWKEGAWK